MDEYCTLSSSFKGSLVLMTCVFPQRKQRFSVFDFISDQPPYYAKERNNNNNNNNHGNIFNCNTCIRDGSHFSTWSPRRFVSAMKIETAVSNVNKREINISSLLEPDEAASIYKYVGGNAALLASGMCQVLTAEDGEWSNPITGVICFVKDYDNKVISLSLLEPGIHTSTAQVNWFTTVTRQFETHQNHTHLLTFDMESPPYSVIGLNFFSEVEAANFHETVRRERESYLNRRVGTKRQAPPPPTAVAQEIHHTQSEVSSLMVLPVSMSSTSAVGIHTELPSTTKTKKKDKDKKKKGFFGTIFGKSSKKKKIQLADISAPSNFQNISHLEESQQQLLHQIMDSMKMEIDHVNEEQLKYLVTVVKEKEHELKTTIESTATEPSDDDKQLGPSNLSGTRSSMRIKRGSREAGRTPRDVKKADAYRKSDNISTSSSDRPVTPAPADFGKPKDPLNPDWEDENQNYASVAPSHQAYPQSKSTPALPSSTPVRSDEAAPPLPTRTVSRRGGLRRQDTPPYQDGIGSSNSLQMPRLPPRVDSIRGGRDVSSRPSLSSSTFVKPLPSEPYDSHHSPPSPPNSPPPPLPSTTVPLRVDTPRLVSLPPENPPPVISVGVPPPPAPPPSPSDLMSAQIKKTPPTMTPPMSPPGGLLSPVSNAAAVSPDRRSFLDEIQSVDKNKLLRTVTPSEKSPEGDRKSGINSGLLSSIQRELEARRTQIGSSSDEESTDSDSGDEWSDD